MIAGQGICNSGQAISPSKVPLQANKPIASHGTYKLSQLQQQILD